MSDDTQETKKSERKPLTLRKTETGAVKQSFPHGRTKTVVVEKKRRVRAPGEAGNKPVAKEGKDAVAPKAPAKKAAVKKPAADAKGKGKVLRQLSDAEQKKRAAVLMAAKKQAEERKVKEEAERADRERRAAQEREKLEAARKEQQEEEKRRVAEAEARKKAEQEAQKALEAEETERKRRQEAKASGLQSADGLLAAMMRFTSLSPSIVHGRRGCRGLRLREEGRARGQSSRKRRVFAGGQIVNGVEFLTNYK
ncbi:MAG: translation initiation factor IF-2 associated domain-containing protein, partial [Pseudomonadota bacterium]